MLRRWGTVVGILCTVFLLVITGILAVNWPFRYSKVEPFLENVFASQIKIDHYRRTYFPHPGFSAEGITLRRDSAPNLPPVGSAKRLFVQGRWIDLIFLRSRLQSVDVEGLHVVIPPVGSRENREDFPPGGSGEFAGPKMLVDHLRIHDSMLDLMRTDGSRFSMPIKMLTIGNLQRGRTVSYTVDMYSPPPTGHILASGTFGPLRPQTLGKTPVTGSFTYAPVHLGEISGLGGTLSAKGTFHGTLGDIEATGQAFTPDFAVSDGRPTPVTNTAQFAVNGLNADIHIHSLTARTGQTVVQAQGEIAGTPKVTNMDLTVTNGRVEDVLRPFLTHFPPVTGPLWLHSHAYVAPPAPGRKFLQRLVMNGAFDIPAQHITSASTEKSLSAFSQRVQDHKASGAAVIGSQVPEPAKDTSEGGTDVLSGLSGPVQLRNAIASTNRLTFMVPGASVNLAGTYNLHGGEVHLLGNLHMESGVSHATTGFKSILFAPLNPFFKHGSSGGVVPIAVTGVPHHYKVSQNILHHK